MTPRPVATAGRPTTGGEPLGPAVASLLAERDLAPSSHRVYVLALDRLLDRPPTGPGRLRPRHRPGPAVLPASRRIFTTAAGGWTLHQPRHSRLTHLAEAGVGLPMLMTKSRHTSLASLAIYAKPTFDAAAAATAAFDPDRRR